VKKLRLWWRGRSRAPLAVAGILSAPLFFAALMAASLAVEKPTIVAVWVNHSYWKKHGHPGRTFIDVVYGAPSAANEAEIWLLAAIPAVFLLVAGVVAIRSRYGIYAICALASGEILLLTVRLDRWVAHHTLRFPIGVDNIPDSSNANLTDRGEWEALARDTVWSLARWEIGLAVAIAVIAAVAQARAHRRRPLPPSPGLPPAAALTAVPGSGAAGERTIETELD
jgi:hypothetical protein